MHLPTVTVQLGVFIQAAELYIAVEMTKEAIDCFINGGEWKKAKKVAVEFDREYEPYVDEKYKQFLKSEGKAEQVRAQPF